MVAMRWAGRGGVMALRAWLRGNRPRDAGIPRPRVPVQSLFDHLEGGDTLDEFLHQFAQRYETRCRQHAGLQFLTARAFGANLKPGLGAQHEVREVPSAEPGRREALRE